MAITTRRARRSPGRRRRRLAPPASGLTRPRQIGLHPAHGAIGDRREDHADEHERAAHEQAEHVARRPHALRAFDFDIDRAEVRTRAPCELLP